MAAIQSHLQNPSLLQSSNQQMLVQLSSPVQPHKQEQNQPKCVQEQLSYKNRLQEFTQRAGLPLPSYHSINEQGIRHLPKFRATVQVDGEKYTSLNTFSNRKAAEQEAAMLALEGISNKIKNDVSKKSTDGGIPPIYEDRVFCKSILHEYAAKTNKEKPTYDTVRLQGLVPVFVSSLVFDGSKYTGAHSINKKEAEQLAARAAIISILGNSDQGTVLFEIVKSKAKQIAALHESTNVGSCVSHLPNSVISIRSCPDKEIVADNALLIENAGPKVLHQEPASKKVRVSNDMSEAGNVQKALQIQSPVVLRHDLEKPIVENFPQPSLLPVKFVPEPQVLPQPQILSPVVLRHDHEKPIVENLPQPSLLPVSFVPQPLVLPQPQGLPSSDGAASGVRRKTRRKKKKAKRASTYIQMQASNLPPSQVVSYPMAQ